MGRLLDRMKVVCRQCGHRHIPRRINGRFLDGDKERISIWQCRECGHLWVDSVFKRSKSTKGQTNTKMMNNTTPAKKRF